MSDGFLAPVFRLLVDGSGLSAEVSRNILDVTLTTQVDTTDTLGFTLANPFPEHRWTHDPGPELFQDGSSVMLSLGYAGRVTEVFDGEITRRILSFPADGMATVRVEAQNRLHRLAGEPKTRTFRGMTEGQVVERIAREANLEPLVEDTGVIHEYLMQDHTDDLTLLRGLAWRLRYELLVEGKVLVFRRADADRGPVCTLVWGQPQKSQRPAARLLPLREIELTLDPRAPVEEVIVRSYDERTKRAIEGRAGGGDEDSAMGGVHIGPGLGRRAFGQGRVWVVVDSPVASLEEADQLARAIYNRKALELVQGRGTTIGLPELCAGQTVELMGLGFRYSGCYYVTQVIQSINEGGFITKFEVCRNSTG